MFCTGSRGDFTEYLFCSALAPSTPLGSVGAAAVYSSLIGAWNGQFMLHT